MYWLYFENPEIPFRFGHSNHVIEQTERGWFEVDSFVFVVQCLGFMEGSVLEIVQQQVDP